MSLLEVENLKISFDSRRGHTDAVKGISFKIDDGESVAIVGESGSGKSVTAMSLMRLLPPPPICSVSGKILCGGKNVGEMTGAELRKARGGEIAYIFQEPSTSFNPLFTVGSQIAEAVRLHSPKGTDVEKTVADSLAEVGIRDAALRARSYPYEMSGGMLQRAMIAMALACRPKLLVADEPTTALDVTIQAQILDLMKSLQKEFGMAIILITHDLGVVAQMCDEVIVMYAGSICEQGTADEIFYNPCHEYTKGLLRSIPSASNVGEKLEPIHGTPIDLLNMPAGCPFAPRCEAAMKICLRERAERMRINEDHLASCWMNVKKGLEDGSIELAEDKDAERKDGADA